jgi:hypothetical protein
MVKRFPGSALTQHPQKGFPPAMYEARIQMYLATTLHFTARRAKHPRCRFFVSGCIAALLLISTTPANFEQGTKGGVNKKDPGYYDRLMDSTFRDVDNVLQLGMDFALNFKEKINKEFLEWATGRPMTADQNENYEAMHVLNQGWELLMQSATKYNELRNRPEDDDTTKRLHAESQELYRQGLELVKQARKLKQAADAKNAARREAERQKKDQEAAAKKEKEMNESKDLAAEFGKLNDEEAKEEDFHNQNIVDITTRAAASQRNGLLSREDDRHQKKMDELAAKRAELGKKIAGQTGAGQFVPPDVAGDDKTDDPNGDKYRQDIAGSDRNGDDCLTIATRKYSGCGDTLAQETVRWENEKKRNGRELSAENSRHARQLQTLQSTNSPGAIGKESSCHYIRVKQLQQEATALQSRHLQCFERLTNSSN